MITNLGDLLLNMVQTIQMVASPSDYEQRRVDEYEDDLMRISTAKMVDGLKPFETSVRHFEYNDNAAVIVEAYDTVEAAKAGHEKWVKLMTADEPPQALDDCVNCVMAQYLKEYGMPMSFPRVPIITRSE